VRDLGLVGQSDPVAIANPIYREVIPRELAYVAQAGLTHDPAWYVGEDGRLRTAALLGAFQGWFREHSEHWLERFQYREAGPQLLLQAFLQRIVNGGGRIEREYGVGRRRMDLAVIWPVRPPRAAGERIRGRDEREAVRVGTRPGEMEQRVVIECKLARRGADRALTQGLEQTAAYMDIWGTDEGHLALFDETPGRTWEERVYRREERHEGRAISVWGL